MRAILGAAAESKTAQDAETLIFDTACVEFHALQGLLFMAVSGLSRAALRAEK